MEKIVVFNEHLKRTKREKQTIPLLDHLHLAEQIMDILWKQLFNHLYQLCLSDPATLDKVDKNIKLPIDSLYKLLQIYRLLLAICHKDTDPDANQIPLISEETLHDLEEQLNML